MAYFFEYTPSLKPCSVESATAYLVKPTSCCRATSTNCPTQYSIKLYTKLCQVQLRNLSNCSPIHAVCHQDIYNANNTFFDESRISKISRFASCRISTQNGSDLDMTLLPIQKRYGSQRDQEFPEITISEKAKHNYKNLLVSQYNKQSTPPSVAILTRNHPGIVSENGNILIIAPRPTTLC
jgi:hypothetical protein